MNQIIRILEGVCAALGKAAGYLTAFLVLLIGVDVLTRYFFNFTYIWVIELEVYFFAFIFLLGGAYAFQKDTHVRVDVFYSKMSPRGQAWVNLIGGILFLLPWCVVVLYVSYNYALASFQIGERSPQPGGLPALYILKFSMVLAFALMFLQALASVLRSLQTLLSKPEPLPTQA